MTRRVKGKGQVASALPGSRKALGVVALMDVAKALQEGRRVSIMFGRIDLKRGSRPWRHAAPQARLAHVIKRGV